MQNEYRLADSKYRSRLREGLLISYMIVARARIQQQLPGKQFLPGSGCLAAAGDKWKYVEPAGEMQGAQLRFFFWLHT